MKGFFVIALTCLCLLSFSAAMAQERETGNWSDAMDAISAPPKSSLGQPKMDKKMDPEDKSALAQKIYAQLPREDQIKLIDESNEVLAYCKGRGFFAKFHDCECVAAKFIEERLVNPEMQRTNISVADQVADECPNVPGAAGYAYEKCMSSYNHKMPVGLKTFCECYGSEFGKFYQENAASVMPNITRQATRAYRTCDESGIASPSNPDR